MQFIKNINLKFLKNENNFYGISLNFYASKYWV